MICGTGQVPEVTLRLRRGDEERTSSVACGDGPVDAIFLAIEQLTGIYGGLQGFQRPQRDGRQGRAGRGVGAGGARRAGVSGRGVSTDSVEASAKAFLNAINRIAAVSNGKQ